MKGLVYPKTRIAIKKCILFTGILFCFYHHSLADEWNDTLTIGVREDCPPFAQADKKEPEGFNGYTFDLCKKIADAASIELDIDVVTYVPINAKDRFCKLRDKKIRLLCGASTVTLKGLEFFSASIYTFISGASIMYPLTLSGASRLDQINVGVLEGTTTSHAVQKILLLQKEISLPPAIIQDSGSDRIKMIPIASHGDCIQQFLTKGEDRLHAYIADREILIALARNAPKSLNLKVSRFYYTVEPYALFMNKDDTKLQALTNRTLSKLFKKQIYDIYQKHFPDSLMNSTLKNIFRLQQLPEGKPFAECKNHDETDNESGTGE